MLVPRLPPVTYKLPCGFECRGSARVASRMAQGFAKEVDSIRVLKRPRDEVLVELERGETALDSVLALMSQMRTLISELYLNLQQLGALALDNVTTPADVARIDEYEVDADNPYPPPPSRPSTDQVLACTAAARAVMPDADFPELAATIETLEAARSHLKSEYAIVEQRAERMNDTLRLRATEALSRADNVSMEQEVERMRGAAILAERDGVTTRKAYADLIARTAPELDGRTIVRSYELVPDLNGAVDNMHISDAILAAQVWLEAQRTSKEAATARRKATVQKAIAGDIAALWEATQRPTTLSALAIRPFWTRSRRSLPPCGKR